MPPAAAPPPIPTPRTPSWAHGKKYDKTLVRDIDDLIERQKHKATADNLRQKLLKSKETRSGIRPAISDNACQTRGSRTLTRADSMGSSEHGVHSSSRATASSQKVLPINARQEKEPNKPAHKLSSSANLQANPPRSNQRSIPTTVKTDQRPQSSIPASLPHHSEPPIHASRNPASHTPIKPSILSQVNPSAKVKKKTRRLKKDKIHQMIRQVRKDILRIAEADRIGGV